MVMVRMLGPQPSALSSCGATTCVYAPQNSEPNYSTCRASRMRRKTTITRSGRLQTRRRQKLDQETFAGGDIKDLAEVPGRDNGHGADRRIAERAVPHRLHIQQSSAKFGKLSLPNI